MKRLRLFAAGMLLVGTSVLTAFSSTAAAQVTPGLDTLRLTLAEGEQAEVPLGLTNEGAAALTLALAPEPAEGASEDLGEMLFGVEFEDYTRVYSFEFAMTDDGRLFVDWNTDNGVTEVKELSPDLEIMRTFEYASGAYGVRGLAWMPSEDAPGYPEGTLWWLISIGIYDPPECLTGVEEVRLVETDLDAVPTGRTIEIPVRPGDPDIGYCTATPFGLGYDPERELFFHLENPRRELWAIGLDGEVPEDYPAPSTDYSTDYSTPLQLQGLDASGSTLDVMIGARAGNNWDRLYRVVVADHDGANTGVETPLMHFAPLSPPQYFNAYSPLRNRLEASIIYFPVEKGDLGGDEPRHEDWIYAVRAAPPPPKWLRGAPVSPELLALDAGGTAEATVKLNASGLAVGTYEGAVAFRENDSGGDVLLRVPVVLTVTPGVGVEEGVAAEETSRLVVYPNPSRGAVTVSLTLAEPSEVRAVVYDVLGREVALLHKGRLGAGVHALAFESAGLPAGLYLVRAEGSEFTTAQRLTMLR